MPEEARACWRQRDALALMAHEELDSHLSLELVERKRYRRSADMASLGRGAEGTLSRNGIKVLELAQRKAERHTKVYLG